MTALGNTYGLLAEYATAGGVLAAARRAYQAGYRNMDAYAPYAVEGLAECVGQTRSRVPFVVFVGSLVGAAVGFLMQYYTMAIDYPMNSGGRPLNSWPAFIPITFEVTILVGALSALFGMIFLNGLPRPHHPLLGVARFERASQDRFFLCIEATDPKYDERTTLEFLLSTSPLDEVIEVLHEPESETELEAAEKQAASQAV